MRLSPFDRLDLALQLRAGRPEGGAGRLTPTLLASSIDLHPHQVEAAIFALTRPFGRGAILADEVGLGKTVEAGLVIAQRLAEGAERVLVLVPASLRAQWQSELARFFGIDARIADRTSLRRSRGRASTRGVTIASLGFFAGEASPEELRDADWDLVVIDEAHRLRNVWQPGAKRARRLREWLRGRRTLLLTATPFQNSLLELYGLVSFVDERLLGAESAFRSRFLADDRGLEAKDPEELRARLSTVLCRTLRRQVLDSIRFTARRSLLYDFAPLPAERELYERVSDYLMRSRAVSMTLGNRELVLLGYRKILASSTFAVAATLRRWLLSLGERLAGGDAKAELPEDLEGFEEEREDLEKAVLAAPWSRREIEAEVAEVRGFLALADSITANAKGERLVGAIAELFARARDKGWPEKAVVFTESRRTQEYLERRLAAAGLDLRIVLFHGGSGDAFERARLLDEFRDRGQVLIATDAGAEGLNLQFCNIVVNYDLPWNPQRIEQRIGRCHRYGQAHDVLVVNFLNTTNAADRRLLELLGAKLKLFDGVFGASDDVLGRLESGVGFERRVLAIYQGCRSAEEVDRAFDRLQHEMEEASTRRLADIEARLLDHFEEEVRGRLAARRLEVAAGLEAASARVRDLVLGAAVRFEADASGRVFTVELPAEVTKRVAGAASDLRVRFEPGAGGEVLGPRHPIVQALVEHVLDSEGARVVHELVVDGAPSLEDRRGRRGHWFRYRLVTAGGPEELFDVALLEGEETPLAEPEMSALRLAPRRHAGYSALLPGEQVAAAGEAAAAERAGLLEQEAALRAVVAIEEERGRLERFAAEALAVGRRQVERVRETLERTRVRAREQASSGAVAAGAGARGSAAGLLDLLEGQLRHEQRWLAEDERRRRRDLEQQLEELGRRLETRTRAVLAGLARFWVV